MAYVAIVHEVFSFVVARTGRGSVILRDVQVVERRVRIGECAVIRPV